MCEDFASLERRKQVSLIKRPMSLKVHRAYTTALDETGFLVGSIIPARISRRICCTKQDTSSLTTGMGGADKRTDKVISNSNEWPENKYEENNMIMEPNFSQDTTEGTNIIYPHCFG